MKKDAVALLVNDIHVGKDNISEFHVNWNEMIDVCHSHNINEIYLGGDLWQSRSSQNLDTLLAVRDALLKLKRQNLYITIAAGNHDLVDQESVWSYNHIFGEYDNVDVIDDYEIYNISDNVLMAIMRYYPENGSFQEHYKSLAENIASEDKTKILYIHEGIRGGLGKATDDELPASMFDDFDTILVGHYHDRKHIPGTNIYYVGSSRQHNFGEDEEKGYTIVYSDGSCEFIKNNANIRFHTIEATSINDDLIDKINKIKSDIRYRVKVKITCSSIEAANIDKSRLSEIGVHKIDIITEQTNIQLTESQSIDQKFDKHEIKKEYSKFCESKGIDDIELGLKYLNKIN